MAGMIIEYDRSPNATTDQKIESLVASIMRALEGISSDMSDQNEVVISVDGFECSMEFDEAEREEIWQMILGVVQIVLNCTLYVDEAGDLYAEYPDGEEAPNFRLDADGNLWFDYNDGELPPAFVYDDETGDLYVEE